MNTAETILEIKFTDDQIRNLLCCAFEGGSNYWYVIVGYVYPPGRSADDYAEKGAAQEKEYWPRYLLLPLHDGGAVKFRTIENDKIGNKNQWNLNRATVSRGFEIMRDKYPRHFADIIAENEDGDTGDVFLQCCLFGEIVFG